MDFVLIFFYVLMSVGGFYFLITASLWYYKSVPTRAQVIGFQKKKDKGRQMPVVTFNDRDEVAVKVGVKTTDHMGFILSGAEKGNEIPVRYAKSNPKLVRLSGLVSFILGGVLQVPLFWFLIYQYGDSIALTQFVFFLTVVCLFGVCWVLLRFIRLSY